MDRDALLDLLTRAVLDGTLTEDEAHALLAAYDADILPAIPLPLPPEAAVHGLDDETIALAAALYVAMSHREITRWHERKVASLSRRTADLPTWQDEMGENLLTHLAARHMAGAKSDAIAADQRPRLDDLAREETAFLSRFADTIAVNRLRGTPMSDPAIAARAETYGGSGQAEYFRAAETIGDARGDGWVVDYRALDDGHTCSACVAAEHNGPYLEGSGPMPGEVCRGRGRCRCVRVSRHDPAAYDRLSGGGAA